MRFCLVLLAFAGAATPAFAQSLELGGEGVKLAMQLSAAPADDQAAGPEVTSQADLTGHLPSLETKVQLGLKTGEPAPSAPGGDPGWWNSTSAGVNAAWTPMKAARLQFGANNSTRLQFSASDPVFSDAAQHYAESRQSGLTASASLTPLAPIDLKLGAELSSNVQQDAWIGGTGARTGDLTQSDNRRLSAELAVSAPSGVKLEAGGQIQSMALAWSGGRAASEPSLEPSARLSAAPWAGGSLKLTLERSVSPLSADQFIGYGQSAVALDQAQPSREWRYGAALDQKAGPIELKASVTRARVQSFAYLALPQTPLRPELGGAAAGAGERSEVSAGLGAPLAVPGLSPFTLDASATWRASAVEDPLTGVAGRMSGERPYEAKLTLSQALGTGVSWGVTAQAIGPQTNLGPSETARLSSTAGLGGFLQYSTRPVTLRLSLDNVLGGERAERDVFYLGARDLTQVDHMSQTRAVDRGVHLSLIRPL